MLPDAILAPLAAQLGIALPQRPREYQTCPRCSHTRSKHWEKCLKVETGHEGILTWCFHCRRERRADIRRAA